MSKKTRSSALKLKNSTSNSKSSDANQNELRSKVIIMPKMLLESDLGNLSIVKLRSPKTGHGDFYLFSGSNLSVFQLMNFDEKYHSWFIDNMAYQDGKLVFATPVDPLFLILPYLKQNKKFMQLDQIVVDSEFPDCGRLLQCTGIHHIGNISDLRKCGELKAYSYSDDKCMSWLCTKVEELIKVLRSKDVNVATGARVATYIRSKRETEAEHVDYLRYAHGLISEYLPESVSESLRVHLNIMKVDAKLVDSPLEPPVKRSKIDGASEVPTEDYSQGNENLKVQNKQTAKLTSAQKALKKVDKSGMKNISSFFAKKNSS